ncbi:glycosyltransferase [Curtobacterium sp. RIT-PI-V]|uniref:glycosyltransferase n=1 Tax=Curtobacterium sp. RIT-PI-V TaxID=3035296 RepID=UPI0021D7D0C0|nr:glycosyltransferase [Curtobacterium sp. RIT-PI-V]
MDSSRDPSPGVDVVVVHFHSDPTLLARCFDSVARSAAGSGVVATLILVNNGGALPLESVPAGLRLVVVESPGNVGFGAAVNLGIAAATAESVLVLNPDAALEEPALGAFLAAGRRVPHALLGGWMIRDGAVERDGYIDWDFSCERLVKRARWSDALGADGIRHVEKVSGGALFAATAVLRRLGPFDEQFFMYCEDADLSRRARAAGHPLVAVGAARVEHAGSASEASFHPLVEAARADGAIRVTAAHRGRVVSILQRVELTIVTCVGLLRPRLAPSARRARRARLTAVRRWRFRATVPRMDPGAVT